MIAIINYGLGNINAFANIYRMLNIPCFIATAKDDLKNATHIILPGVGSFDHAMSQLIQSGMREALDECVLEKKLPVLGICVGMQMLARSSEEGAASGLGWINGVVKKLVQTENMLLPHMGWNDVEISARNKLFSALEEDARFYFLHSYYFSCHDAKNSLAVTDYFGQFTCAVNHENIYGVQFHPEKSHRYGTQLLKNFASI